MDAPRHSPTSTPGVAGILVALGLAADEDDSGTFGLSIRLANLKRIWPIAVLAQVIAVAFAVAVAAFEPPPAPVAATALIGAVGLLLSAGLVGVLFVRVAHVFPPHRSNAIVTVGVAGIGASFLALGLEVAAFTPGAGRIAALAGVAGALGVTLVSAHQIRAATLGLAAGLAVTLTVFDRHPSVAGVVAAFAICVAVVTIRLARIDRRNVEAHARESREGKRAATMIAEFEVHGTGWFWEADRVGRVTYLSAKVAAELAERGEHPIGRLITDIFRMDSASPGTERTLAFHISSRTSFSDYSVCSASDEEAQRWWSISGRPSVDELGRFKGFIGSGTDLTHKRQSEAEITRLALFDSLTGLANRQRMRMTLDKTLQQQVGTYRPSSLFLMDLDRFKAVNDTLGHQAGDLLLKQVAQRLERTVGEAGLVGRLGGDEFEVLLPGIDSRDTLSALAVDIIAALSQPYFISGASVTIGCSIGAAIAPEHGEDAESLTRNADLALYAAKADGRGVHRFYSDDMLEGARSRKQLEDDMRAAIAAGGFHLAYQPVVSTEDAHIVGYEALVRWDHPTRGAISPADFIPTAEECGLIEALGEWVLRTACTEAACWPGEVRVAVNVSPIQFANPGLPALVASALANSGLPAHRLELEITEGVFLDESSSSDQMFKALKGLGVRLALDDFGTGYSSLGYLRTAPFDKIKIDQSFVRGAAQPGNRNAAIIRAIVTLADTLGMETTAEGVEIQDEIALVRSLGCSHIQGFVYGRAALAADVREQLGGGVSASASGHKVSRSPRTRVLRSARLAIAGVEGDVRIRNISTSGAMIDGIAIDDRAIGIDVLIELVENQMFEARVAWAADGKAGLEFSQAFNLDRLNQPTRTIRRTA